MKERRSYFVAVGLMSAGGAEGGACGWRPREAGGWFNRLPARIGRRKHRNAPQSVDGWCSFESRRSCRPHTESDMPRVSFESLPASARLWIFAAERPVTGSAAGRLLDAVDEHLDRWNAHGAPLTCARE